MNWNSEQTIRKNNTMLQFVNVWLLLAQKSCWPFLLLTPILLILVIIQLHVIYAMYL